MNDSNSPVETEKVACAVCRKEIPLSEAKTPEAVADYVAHFCGLDCYEQWKQQSVKAGHRGDKTGS
ncbi:MAG TPA: DUF3330 domain-containing protein [Gallionella sp.]|nr:DUF3330 domain-containing protein [Gallionella sp.]